MPVTKIKSKWESGNLKFTDNSGNEILSFDSDNKRILLSEDKQLTKVAKVALGNAADTGGAVLSWVNPEAGTIAITRLLVNVTTVATGAATVDFGTTATNGTTLSANLIDGVDVNAATGLFDNIDDAGTDGKSKQLLAEGKWLTGSRASGAVAGLVGFAYIEYIVI